MRLRLFLAFALIIAVTLMAVAGFIGVNAAKQVHSFMARGGIINAESTVQALEDYYAEHGSWEGAETLLGSSSMPGVGRGQGQGQGMMGGGMALRLADASGNLIYDPDDPQASGQLTAEQLADAIALQVDGSTVGYLVPPPGTPLLTEAQQTALVSRLNQASLWAALIAGALGLVLALVLAHLLLKPVRQLTQAATQVAQGDLSQRVKVSGGEELAALGKSFNYMAESLEQAQGSRRALTADIAHELRTPLAVQRANLEAILDGVYPLNSENLGSILEQNQMLTRLVEDLRTLALADAGELALERTPTDLPALVQRVAERFQPQADQKDVRITTELPERCPKLLLDPGRIAQILTNLLSNALRHTPENGQIRLELEPQAKEVELRVGDSGPGIPPEDLPHIFERFFRSDRSRSRQEGGTGLGLAIASKLAQAHGGRLSAANHPEGGAVFTLRLPLP